jgi:pimeloyl-ACP methyl ester carboxylesterase
MSDFPDVVVLIPGITGSVLERNGKEVWAASASAVLRGLSSGGKSISDLYLENDDPDLDDLGDGVKATGLVQDVHLFPGLWTIDGYTKVSRRLCDRLRLERGTNFFELPYDWRRDNRVASRALQRNSAVWLAARRNTHPNAKLVLVAHSMGGLVSRYFLEVLGGWKETRALITFGTPYRGSLNALDSLVNGVKKLGIVDLTTMTRSLTSIYQLLPIYRCYDTGNGRIVRLSETENIPCLDAAQKDRIKAADRFHREIELAVAANQAAARNVERYKIYPIVGSEQPTSQAAVATANGVDLLRAFDGVDEGGDGTVPRVSASPIEAGEERAAFAVTRHGSLQNTDAALAHVVGLLTTPRDLGARRAIGAPTTTVSLDVDGVFAAGEPVVFAARPSTPGSTLEAVIEPTDGSSAKRILPLPDTDDEWRHRELPPLQAGVYRITVQGDPTKVEPVSDVFGVV